MALLQSLMYLLNNCTTYIQSGTTVMNWIILATFVFSCNIKICLIKFYRPTAQIGLRA